MSRRRSCAGRLDPGSPRRAVRSARPSGSHRGGNLRGGPRLPGARGAGEALRMRILPLLAVAVVVAGCGSGGSPDYYDHIDTASAVVAEALKDIGDDSGEL